MRILNFIRLTRNNRK